MSVQHDYRGQGDPNTVNGGSAQAAALNSHYLNTEDFTVWFCVYSDAGEYGWKQMPEAQPASEVTVVNSVLDYADINDNDLLVRAGASVVFSVGVGVHCNLALTGNPATLAPSQDTFVTIRRTSNDELVAIATAVSQYPVINP